MTIKEWLNSMSKEELAFRLYGKDYFQQRCDECVMYKPDGFGKYKCMSKEFYSNCKKQFEEWLDEEMN